RKALSEVDGAVLDRELRDLGEYGRPERSELPADRWAHGRKLSVIRYQISVPGEASEPELDRRAYLQRPRLDISPGLKLKTENRFTDNSLCQTDPIIALPSSDPAPPAGRRPSMPPAPSSSRW